MTRRVATLAPLAILALLAPLAATGTAAQETPPAAPPAGTAPPAPAPTPAPAPYVLSLQDAQRAALENNLNLAVRSFDPLRAETRVIFSESAFDPTITGTLSAANTERPSVTSFLPNVKTKELNIAFTDPTLLGGNYTISADAQQIDLVVTNEWDLSWRIGVVQPLLRGFGVRANKTLIVESRNLLGINRSAFRQSVLDTLAATEKAYWDLNFSLMNLRTSQAALKLAQDFLEQNRIKVRVGTLAPIEITQAEAQVADREEAVIIAENLVRTAEDALRTTLNVPKDSPIWSQSITPSDPLQLNEVTPNMDQAVATALQRRPDLEQARLDLQTRETDLAWRANQRRWNLNLVGNYGKVGISNEVPSLGTQGSYGDAFDNLRAGQNLDWQVFLTLGVPIGNRQAISSYTDSEYALQQSRKVLEATDLTARVQVRDAVRGVETTLKRVKSAQVNVRLQREKLAAEQKKFENGMSTSFQVLQFQNDLFAAASRENLAMVDYNKNLVELERVQGTLLDSRNVEVPDGAARRTVPYRPHTRADAPGGERRPAGEPAPFDMAGAGSPGTALPDRFTFERGRLVARGAAVTWSGDTDEDAPRSGTAAP